MTTIRRTPIRAVLAVIALLAAYAAVQAGGGTSPVGAEPPTPSITPGGTLDGGPPLVLQTGAEDKFVWDTKTQLMKNMRDITGSSKDNCFLALQGDDLVSFSAGTNTPGFVDNSIGVYGGGGGSTARGVACSRVDGLEALSFSLHGALADYAISSAVLDVELKSNAWAVAELKLNGTHVGWEELQTGSSIGTPQKYVTPDTCGAVSDSGPDSGPNDNCPWTIATSGVYFDEIVFTMAVGAMSLEGGSDWGANAADHRSVFQLAKVTGILDCGGTFGADEEGDVTVSGTRLDNIDGDACTPMPYFLDTDGNTMQLLKQSGDQEVAFAFETTWVEDDEYPVGPTYLLFDDDPDLDPDHPELSSHQLDVCVGNATYDVDGNLTGMSGLTEADDMVSGLPGIQYGCIYDEVLHYVSPGVTTLTQSVYVQGDLMKYR